MTPKHAATPITDSSSLADSHFSLAHLIEQGVRRELLSHEEWEFHSLVVHRMPDGVCLQGVLECDNPKTIDEIVKVTRQIPGVSKVINQIVVQKKRCSKPPLKG
jgi:BON domain